MRDLFSDNPDSPLQGSVNDVPAVYDDRKSVDMQRILQPKSVTRAKYRMSRLHYQMMVRIREELQCYISNHPEDIIDGKAITVPLFTSHFPGFKGDNVAFFRSVQELISNSGNLVSFEWVYNSNFHKELFEWMQKRVRANDRARMAMPKDGDVIQKASVIIIDAMRCSNDPSKVIVSINPLVAPFLLYYGPGVGGTCFDRDVLLKLTSWYSCRLYELIMDWSTSTDVKVISLDELREVLQFPDSYTAREIKRRALDVAKIEFEEYGSSVLFDYKMKYDSAFGYMKGTRGPVSANCVEFTFYKQNSVDTKELSRKAILIMLQGVAEPEKRFMCDALAKQIVNNGQSSIIMSKFSYYQKRVSAKKMTDEEFRNTMLKIIREVSGVDLRSDVHIRNSCRYKNRTKKIDNEPRLLFEFN